MANGASATPADSMPTSSSSGLLRLLLSFVARFRLTARGIVLALRNVLVSSWSCLLGFARLGRYSRIQLSASNVCTNPVSQHTHQSLGVEVDEAQDRSGGPIESPPVQVDWPSRLSILRDLTMNCKLPPFSFHYATPVGGSQRYYLDNPRTNDLPVFADAKDKIPPGQQTLALSLSPLSHGWRRYVHPEGVCLFYHEELRIFTEHDISDHTKEEEILICALRLVERAIQTDGITLDESTEIVLNVDRTIARVCHYYFVDHIQRLLFWVDEVGVKDLGIHPRKNSGYNHIKYMVESYYWSHCEYYPHTCPLSKEVVKGVKGTLNYAKIDMITTDSSSSPFGQDELVAMLALLDSIKDDNGILDTHDTWAIARLMAYFTENQFLNFCGQTCARLNADTPLFGKPKWHRRPLFQVINLFLLGSPSEHAVRLQRVWVDGTIIQPRWKDFVNRLTAELARYTIFSTVMLAVNFSFLGVPGVIGSAKRSIQIMIYCSIVSTVASIVSSFVLLNVYSNPRLLIARNVTQAFGALTTKGMAGLAITHSLPIASLIWSITLFSTALAVQIFSPKDRATVIALSVEGLVIVVFVIMGVNIMGRFNRDRDNTNASSYTRALFSACRKHTGRGDNATGDV